MKPTSMIVRPRRVLLPTALALIGALAIACTSGDGATSDTAGDTGAGTEGDTTSASGSGGSTLATDNSGSGSGASTTGGGTTIGPTSASASSTGDTSADGTSTSDATSDTNVTTTDGGPGSVDPSVLDDHPNYPDHCVPANTGVDIHTLIADGVISGDPDVLSCVFKEYDPQNDPNVGVVGHGNLPTGIAVTESCESTGAVDPALPLGSYVWIMTVVDEQGETVGHIPYCAAQTVPHPGAYGVEVLEGGEDVTFQPAYVTMDNGTVSYGAPDDPEVRVTRPCGQQSCFYKYFFGYNSIPGTFSGQPSGLLPGQDGMHHAVQLQADDVAPHLHERFWVINSRWDYCLYGSDSPPDDAQAENEALCGTKDLAQQNGDDSNLEFGFIVRPQP